MNIEANILDGLKEESERIHNNNRREVASAIVNRFMPRHPAGRYIIGVVEDSLTDTKYSNVFGTGNVYWSTSGGKLIWYPKVEAKNARGVRDYRDLEELTERLRS